MLLPFCENGLQSKMSALAPPMADARIQYLTAVSTIASGNSWQSPVSQRHLYEIHTTSQGELISGVLSAEQIVEFARLRDFL
jgi:hypothetical protein